MTKYKILEILRENKDNFISGEFLSKKLKVSRTAIWKGVNSLKEKGYQIEGINNKGYKLIDDNKNILSEYEIKKYIIGKELGKNIFCFEKINSTNTYIKLKSDSLKHGDIVIANEQTKGRGRMQKVFYSPKETGIYMSIFFKKNIFYDSLKLLSIASFISVCHAIEKCTGFSPSLTWNDIKISEKKICGILTECSFEGESGKVEYSVIGIGINVNNSFFPKNIKDKTTSLKIELGKEINRTKLIAEIINEMEKLICNRRYITKRENILKEYMNRLSLINQNVEIKILERKIIGQVIGINNLGGLIILKENGKHEIIYNGELSLLKNIN